MLASATDVDLSRLEAALLDLHEHDAPCAGVDHGRVRHGQHRRLATHRHLHLREHRRLELAARVGHLDPHRNAARFRLQRRVDVGDAALEGLVGVGRRRDARLRAALDQADVLFRQVSDDPDRREVGHLVEHLARHEAHPLQRLLFRHDARDRRWERDRALRLARLHQCRHLRRRQIPVAQPRQAGVGELPHAGLRVCACVLHRFDPLHRDGVLALGRHELGTVGLEQRLTLGHRLPGRVDVQALDVAFELRVNRKHPAFVRLNAAGGAHGLAEQSHRGGLGAHT